MTQQGPGEEGPRGQSPVRRWISDRRWFLIGGLALGAFVLGAWGFRIRALAVGESRSLWHHLYLSLQLFTLESGSAGEPHPWQFNVARFLAPASALLATATALLALFGEQFKLLAIRLRRRHVVVCGLGRTGQAIAHGFRDRGDRVVVIEREEDAPGIRGSRERRIPVVVGDATDPAILERAQLRRARYLFAVCGADETNAEVMEIARSAARSGRTPPLRCFAHIVDPDLSDLLRADRPGAGADRAFRPEFFNIHQAAARTWASEHPVTLSSDGSVPRVLVVGLDELGERLILETVRRWLTLDPLSGRRIRIAVVDEQAEGRLGTVLGGHPQLERFADLTAIAAGPRTDGSAGVEVDEDGPDVTDVYVCLDDPSRALATALAIRRRVRSQAVPIVVRMPGASGVARLMHGAGRFPNLHAFPLAERTCRPEILLGETTTEILARAVHREYLRNRAVAGETLATNPSMVDWEDLPEDQKESNRHQAEDIGRKLRAVGLRTVRPPGGEDSRSLRWSGQELERLARMEHDRWMAERLLEGWSHAEGPKDVEARTSPHIVPWSGLSEEIRELDREAVRGIPGLVALAGLRVERVAREDAPAGDERG